MKLRRFLRGLVGARFVDIEKDEPHCLELKSGTKRTVFEKESRQVFQNGVLISSFDHIDVTGLELPRDQEGTSNW